MRKYVVEFIGTFFLVGTIGFTVMKPGDAGAMAPLAIGSVLMVMIFAGGHISGGHYNPARHARGALRGKCTWADAVASLAAQFLAAAVAADAVLLVKASRRSTAFPTL